MRRIPALERTGIRKFFSGPESFTPDDRYLLGEAPELAASSSRAASTRSASSRPAARARCWRNGSSRSCAGGPGRRRHPAHAAIPEQRPLPARPRERGSRAAVRHALAVSPVRHGAPARTSPFHERLKARGACFAEAAGWERPGWFAPAGAAPEYDYAYGRTAWFERWASEHRAVRERLGLFDLSSFGKFLVQGRDAETVLQRICANDVAVAPGRIVYTPWLNARGGIEADLTVTRLAADAYLVVTSAASQNRDLHWLKRHVPEEAHAFVTDVTSGYAVLALMGPESRALLAELTSTDLSNDAFPFGTAQEIEVGYALVRAQRISYVGELGFELYIPSEFAPPVFDAIAEAAGGRLSFAGFHALDSLRLEKAYRHWGHDIGDEDTPLDAGLGFACAFDTAVPFLGCDALLEIRERTPTKRLVQFRLLDPEPLLFRDEPIVMDGDRIGLLTSGSYGHTMGTAIGMGWVRHPDGVTPELLRSARFEIEVAGECYPAEASLHAFYDPKGARMRA